jgi:cation/acetate symporter
VLASARTLAEAPQASAWDVYLTSVLPAAAAAAGNEAAMLTQASLAIEPLGLLLALPELSEMPAGAALIVPGMLAAALVVAAALAASLLSLSRIGKRDESTPGGIWRARALVLAAGAVAAGLAAMRPGDLVTMVVSALSLAAAGLFPVLALGLAWKRATAAGAIAAILVGGGVTLYYDVGIQVFPAAFYRTWAPLSNAGEFAAEEFATLETEAREAESPEARSAAATALETLARGTATRRGLANWFGIDSASGAVFGVPLGLLALLLVSVLTRRSASQP